MKTISIKGKQYVPVNERLKAFRDSLPGYSLRTELILVDSEQALIKAVIRDEKERIVAEGTSYERADNKMALVNVTSHVENAETSAWGRALGNFGIGIDASVATADEVANAVLNQDRPVKVKEVDSRFEPATDKQIETIKELMEGLDEDFGELCKATFGGKLPNKTHAMQVIPILKAKLSTKLDTSRRSRQCASSLLQAADLDRNF